MRGASQEWYLRPAFLGAGGAEPLWMRLMLPRALGSRVVDWGKWPGRGETRDETRDETRGADALAGAFLRRAGIYPYEMELRYR